MFLIIASSFLNSGLLRLQRWVGITESAVRVPSILFLQSKTENECGVKLEFQISGDDSASV